MTRGTPRTRPVSKPEAIQFMAKAEDFLATAEDALNEGRCSPAAGNAVHAGINAADAILGAVTGHRSAGQDHGQAVDLLHAVPIVGKDAANRLRRLLPLKTRAEYDPAPVSLADATRAVDLSRALVGIAREVVAARLRPD
jgi:HEPN domain-containing protein